MCGITGIFAFNLVGNIHKIHIANAAAALSKRGPDYQDLYADDRVGLGHRRLSIIDVSHRAHQPMWDESQRYCIVFNGEIFNFKELKQSLIAEGVSFRSQSDTEVLLKLLIKEKEKCLPRLNGFFAFCLYDRQEQSFFLARDRFGIKPLLYAYDEDKFLFASEMKSLLQYGIDRSLDYTALHTYLQLNYIPAPRTIFQAVKKLMPGQFMKVVSRNLTIDTYYTIPVPRPPESVSYEKAKEKLGELLEAAVQRRLVSDVPLGAFLSGGIDSSVVTGLASRHKRDLHTFSIGFRDERFFDETAYAQLVARHFGTEHTVFLLTNNDLFECVHHVLDYLDEPFADSSAINVFILSRETRKHATVALSGDGADELLGGYNKHAAHYRTLHAGWMEKLVSSLRPVWNALPQSRNSAAFNKIRQLQRFAEGMVATPKDRYWRWAAFADESVAARLLSDTSRAQLAHDEIAAQRAELLRTIPDPETIGDVLLTDTQLVLPNDMLTKVDLMSMANSLEVRVPFLDYTVVNFLFSLPDDYKINASMRKRVLQDTFRGLLPEALYNRPKKGFEVPLLKWFRNEMKSLITDDLLSKKFVDGQGVFQYAEIEKLKQQLFSSNPGDSPARIWGLIVFQWWWRKTMST